MLIIIPGRPVPAVRMTGRGKYVKPEAINYLNYKHQIGWLALNKSKKPIIKPIVVKVKVYLHGKSTPMGRDGDVDNYLKSALDGCNKVVWVDDRQVMKATVEKVPCRAKEERMEIEICEMEE
ncbi:RusA family crossover junction endodeoxyribonuclease [Desulfosporosinus sp. PR]|uniref:RusA family crossover junction endodeoxyribonuclease n=1 Tax=Candidatus Desulfosporosinus nitrosoreducens TaxID=3401928 RepID=UPI0027E8261B|nr:RusA family crossover junction endodeoxyribonuclease [Desulfosporosinus sp. PR]MDQ7094192.1 RusA family crossover junction endodeoxyribonuclease [Desulfosporosinus sp. PR]